MSLRLAWLTWRVLGQVGGALPIGMSFKKEKIGMFSSIMIQSACISLPYLLPGNLHGF